MQCSFRFYQHGKKIERDDSGSSLMRHIHSFIVVSFSMCIAKRMVPSIAKMVVEDEVVTIPVYMGLGNTTSCTLQGFMHTLLTVARVLLYTELMITCEFILI